jgi:hypothetical protein
MKTWKVIGGLLLLWLVILIYMSNSFTSDNNANDLDRQLKRALRELERLKTQNDQLKSLSKDLR